MIFKSRQINSDRAPWRNPNDGERRSRGVKWVSGPDVFEPRPEFNTTRDPLPYVDRQGGFRADRATPTTRFDPRPEFDHPVNRILEAFRENPDIDLWDMGFAMFTTYGGERDWETEGHYFHSFTVASINEIDHARRVLARLANWKDN
jgi:hypothetical protein